MHRSKFTAAALAALMAFAATLVIFAGEAAATEWHVYEGDIHPGHAYGLAVPADASAVEVLYEGTGAAELAVFDPAGELVAFYELSQSPSKATIVQPAEGRHVIYVYEVAQGALTVRVNAEEAPPLSLQKIPLAREDVVLTQVEQPEALDQVITAHLELTPVFVTLLYEGSAQDLDATVSSTRGPVVTILDETATAFSPGVWASQTGTRTSEAANLASGAYTVALQAASFEGTLVLTSLALDLTTEVPVDQEVDVVVPPVQESDAALFPLAVREALAVQLPAGTLVIADAEHLQAQAEAAAQGEDNESDSRKSHKHGSYRHYAHASVSVYTPTDELLGVLRLGHDEPVATIELPEAGEYVLYTSRADNELLAKVQGAVAAPPTRVLELAETKFEFVTPMNVASTYTQSFELEHIPVAMSFRAHDGLAVWEFASIENEKGVVADMQMYAQAGPGYIGGTHVDRTMFAAGEHTLNVDGLAAESRFELRAIHYVRDVVETPVVEPAAHPAAPGAGGGGPDEEQSFLDELRELLPF